jgi:formylglycine-generating enzyme required for sulfatase activity
MNRETTRIDLPPPRMIQPPRKSSRRWAWLLLVILALALGTGAGLWVGTWQDAEPNASSTKTREITEKTEAAREAVEDGDWYEARRLFLEVKELDPENPDALASIPLIDRRLEEVRGSVEIRTEPVGATIRVEGIGEFTSPATIEDLPLGKHRIVISMTGYEEFHENVEIQDDDDKVTFPLISLARSAGQLEVVSEPKGAEFRLIKKVSEDEKELVEVGNTPAYIEELAPGEYQVLMAVEGWPEYSEVVRVENNRNSSVSAVFSMGGLNIKSDPPGAEVWIKLNERLDRLAGNTPLHLGDLPVGSHRLELRYEDWAPIRRTVEVVEDVTQDLDFEWERALVTFRSDPPGAEVFLDSLTLGNGRDVTPFRVELPEGDYRFVARHSLLGSVEKTVYVDPDLKLNEIDFPFSYGSVSLTSKPPGAAVISEGRPIGRTPLDLAVVPPGSYTYELRKERHRSTTVSGTLEPGGVLDFNASLKYDPAPVASHGFTNGVKQELVWFAALDGWVAAHETTQAQYERVMGANPSYFKAPNHPVESVTWYDAVKYCEALTVLEQGLGNLPQGFRYRLPTDGEWSRIAGGQKLDGAISSLFDRKKSTAPIGSLAPNEFGLHDVRGNVWEWVSDWYSQQIVTRVRKEGATPNLDWVGTDRKVLRGGAWNRSSRFDLEVANRMAARPSAADRYDVGFRVFLMRN